MDIYVVKKGDTLYRIAREFGLSVNQLIEINQLSNPDRLIVGQSLIIPVRRQPDILVNGYTYPNINRTTLRNTLPYLTYLCIFSYQVTPRGTLRPINDEALIEEALNQQVAPMLVVTNIGESGRFESDLAHLIFNDMSVQDQLVESILKVLQEKNYYGVDLDFEYVYPMDRALYNRFLKRMADTLHPLGYTLTTALAPKVRYDQPGILYEAHDYYAHGKYADHVILMTYEWGYRYGPPMAVAPINQVERVLNYALTVIPSEKILMGIPNYGYDWTLPYQEGTAANSISNTQALELAIQKGAEIQFDSVSQSPYFYYKDNDQNLHVVWFEDARSIQAKLNLVDKYKLGGISFWTIMNYFPQGYWILDHQFTVQKLV